MDPNHNFNSAAGEPSTVDRARIQRILQGGGRLPSMCANPNLVFASGVPMRGIDQMSTGSNSDSEEEDEEDEDGDQDEPLSAPPQRKRSRKVAVPRAVVDELHVVHLVKAYRVEFAAFCRGKKQAPKQMIPEKVWEKVYKNHYLVMFPCSTFEEDTLKKHLREQLAELDTGIADDGQRPVLQDELIATEVRATDCAATRNILRVRQGLVGGVATGGPPSASTSARPFASSATATPAPPAVPVGPRPVLPLPPILIPPPTVEGTPSIPITPTSSTTSAAGCSTSERLTKSEMLQRQASAVCSLAVQFEATAEKQRKLADAKASLADTRNTRQRVDLLEIARAAGLVEGEEYKIKLQKILEGTF